MYVAKSGKGPRKDTDVLRAMQAKLPGNVRHSFAVEIIRSQILGRGYLVSATRLNYTAFTPLILIDHLFTRGKREPVATTAKMFPKSGVKEVVRLLLDKFHDMDYVIQEMRKHEELSDYDPLECKDWHPHEIRKFVGQLCDAIGEPIPTRESRRLYVAVAVFPTVSSYGRGEMEQQDVWPVINELMGDDRDMIKHVIQYVRSRVPELASFLSERFGLGPLPHEVTFVPACQSPFNRKLHDLVRAGEIVVREKCHIDAFVHHLRKSRFYAVDVHMSDAFGKYKERVGMISFAFQHRVFLIMPYLFPNSVIPIAAALEMNPRTVITYRWAMRGAQIRETLKNWTPAEIVIAEDVATENGKATSLDAFAEFVTGGKLCRRAANFSDAAMPSPPALQHRAIRALLIREFVRRLRNLQEDDAAGSSQAAPSQEEPGRRKRDRESHHRADLRKVVRR